MAKVESLGIKRVESIHYYVHDLERSRRFYAETMDFAEIGGSSEELTRAGRQRSLSFMAANCVVTCSAPQGEGGRAWRYLRKHPDGVGTLIFEVEDIDEGVRAARGARRHAHQATSGVEPTTAERCAIFSITTPFGDTTFRFVERRGYRPLFPGFVAHDRPRGGRNRFGFVGFDHVTSNFQTMKPRAAVARARAGARADTGRCSFTRPTSAPRHDPRLRPQVRS